MEALSDKPPAAAAAAAAAPEQQQQQQQQMLQDLVLPRKPLLEGAPQSLAALRRKALAAVSSRGAPLLGAPQQVSPSLLGPPCCCCCCSCCCCW
ncbi:hypothetical protein ETH_00042845 [Eimeria tenella]|uniref:Uncharacterized protein n=1 Tax=Eimeria tenella TaxID=5802 RepID=U6KT52_EIMTE|nr:hypothetical protein ETH_00042845 [Eimeria tenella]CDJ40103.1 hypothetical protein ETH_00042845 [Eimeria tenella]|eukprot:XP_013230856.1 hypothetical protein ETH_00042845 [Eimeria tenella]